MLASLVDDSNGPPRPLVHLGRIEGVGTGVPWPASSYTVGIVHADGVEWTPLGLLDLQNVPAERVILAVLSALAMRHVRESQLQIGDEVLVLGRDPWSLLLLQWARLQGGSPIVFASEVTRGLNQHASSMGVDVVVSDLVPDDLARTARLTYRGAGFTVVFDTIASEQSVSRALPVLRDGGRYMLAGFDAQQHLSFNAYPDLHRRDLEVVSASYPGTVNEFVELFRFGMQLVDIGRLRVDFLEDRALGWRVEVRQA